MNYCVYLNGFLVATHNVEFDGGRPTFTHPIAGGSVVTVLVYDGGCLFERREYKCHFTDAGQPLNAESREVTYF